MQKCFLKIIVTILVATYFMLNSSLVVADQCPSATSVHYDTKSGGRFVGASASNVLWQSTEMASLNPLPAVEYLGMSSVGEKNHAQVSCNYRSGLNSFQLTATQHAMLGQGWQLLRDQFYFCGQKEQCDFVLIK